MLFGGLLCSPTVILSHCVQADSARFVLSSQPGRACQPSLLLPGVAGIFTVKLFWDETRGHPGACLPKAVLHGHGKALALNCGNIEMAKGSACRLPARETSCRGVTGNVHCTNIPIAGVPGHTPKSFDHNPSNCLCNRKDLQLLRDD